MIGSTEIQAIGAKGDSVGLCLHTCFAAVAARMPHAIAAVCGHHRVTYGELDKRANYVAHQLRAVGVRREVLVGLYVERSIGMLVSLLGILKAGGAYVPIDLGYPAERIGLMLEDAQIHVVITEKRLVEQLPPHDAVVMYVEADARDGCDHPPENDTSPENLAYVIYTSGSTGAPKGVQVAHSSVLSLFEATCPLINFGEADIWSSFHSSAFDFSVWEIFGCLLSGGRLIVVPRELTQSSEEFCNLLHREKVTILSQTPTALRQLAYAKRKQTADGCGDLFLRLVICGGEALPPDLALQVLDWNVPLWNFYGPTEATVWATAGKVEPRHCCVGSVSIGRPLNNCEVYVLDSNGDPLPKGEAGELCISGRALARGYLNRPHLTSAKFVKKAIGDRLGKRIYRTGDIGRYQMDGTLEFLGRLDEQVKIRGFRVELGEIEAALARHSATRECVVVARGTAPGDKRLVAYVVRNDAASSSASTFRDFLKEILPDYMVPTAYVFLDALPLTSNGKIDRLRLPSPQVSTLSFEPVRSGPRDELEAELVKIWRNVLGTHDVDLRDSFFDLGGDSFRAVQLLCEIEKTCGKYLPLATLLRAPTIEKLARTIRDPNSSLLFGLSLVPMQPRGAKPPLFCIGPTGGTVFGFTDLVSVLDPSQPVYGLQSRGVDEEQAPFTKVEDIARHYIEEIRATQPKGPYFITGHCFGALVAFEMAQQLVSEGERIGLLCMLDPDGPGTGTTEISFFARISVRLAALRRLPRGKWLSFVMERLKNIYIKRKQNFWKTMVQMFSFAHARPRFLWNVEYANNEAIVNYSPRPLHGHITLFRARERPLYEDVSQLEWRKFATDGVELHEIPGTHHTMMKEPHVRVLAAELEICLQKMSSQSRGHARSRTPARSSDFSR